MRIQRVGLCTGVVLFSLARVALGTELYAMTSHQQLWRLNTKANGGQGEWTSIPLSGAGRSFTHGIAVDSKGNVYAANTGTYGGAAILKITISEEGEGTVSNFPVGANVVGPWGVAVGEPYLFISDTSNKRVLRCGLDGSAKPEAVASSLDFGPRGLCFTDGDLYVAGGGSVLRIGHAAEAVPDPPEEIATLDTTALTGIAYAHGTIYVTNTSKTLYSGMPELTPWFVHWYAGLQPVVAAKDFLYSGDGIESSLYEYSRIGELLRDYGPKNGQTIYGLAVIPPPPPPETVVLVR